MKLFERPFSVNVEYIDDADTKLEFLDFRSNQVLYDVFQQKSLLEFYSRLEEEEVAYSVLLGNAIIWICQFASTYCFEQAFSIMKINKSQLRTRLTFIKTYVDICQHRIFSFDCTRPLYASSAPFTDEGKLLISLLLQ